MTSEINLSAPEVVDKHFGPGPHPGTGTSQKVHGGGGGGGVATSAFRMFHPDLVPTGDPEQVFPDMVDREVEVAGMPWPGKVTVRWMGVEGGDPDLELSDEMREGLEGVPSEIWDAANNPKVVVVNDTQLFGYVWDSDDPFQSPVPLEGLGLYMLPETFGPGSAMRSEPDGGHVLYISDQARTSLDSDLNPGGVKHTIAHELGHAVTLPRMFPDMGQKVLITNTAQLATILTFQDDLPASLRGSVDPETGFGAVDPWFYPRTVAENSPGQLYGEFAAEAFAHMARGDRAVVNATDFEITKMRAQTSGSVDQLASSAFAASFTDDGFTDITDYLDSFFDGEVPLTKRVNPVTVFSGHCATQDWIEWVEQRTGSLVEKHFGPGTHPGTGTPQSIHGRERRTGSRRQWRAIPWKAKAVHASSIAHVDAIEEEGLDPYLSGGGWFGPGLYASFGPSGISLQQRLMERKPKYLVDLDMKKALVMDAEDWSWDADSSKVEDLFREIIGNGDSTNGGQRIFNRREMYKRGLSEPPQWYRESKPGAFVTSSSGGKGWWSLPDRHVVRILLMEKGFDGVVWNKGSSVVEGEEWGSQVVILDPAAIASTTRLPDRIKEDALRSSLSKAAVVNIVMMWDEFWASLGAAKVVEKHFGPGDHPGTGTPQKVHGSGGGKSNAISTDTFKPSRAKNLTDPKNDLELAVDSWKHNPGDMSRNMMAILEGRSVGRKDHPHHLQAQALLDALRNAPVTRKTLWRGQDDLPQSMIKDGDLQLNAGDEFDFFWAGTSPEARTAAQLSVTHASPAERGMLFKFEGRKNALPIDQIFASEFASENEHLLSGTFKVVSIKPVTNRDLKAIDPFRGMDKDDRFLLTDVVDLVTVRQVDHFIDDPFKKRYGGEVVDKHFGPGVHPGTGTSQKVHAGLVRALKGQRQLKGEKIDSFLVHADGTPMSMMLDGLPPEVQAKIFKSAAEQYNLTTDMELIRSRYEVILAAAEARYKENPELRDDDRFYERWFETWESEGKGRFELEQVVAAAGVISPGLEAEVTAEQRARGIEDNVTMTRRMMDLVDENPTLNVFQAAVVNDMVGALNTKYLASSRSQAVAAFYDFEITANTRFNDLPNGYVQAQALHMMMQAEDGSGVPAQRGWRNWALGFDVLSGRASPSDVLGSAKTRSFYNNIMDPTDTQGRGDVTVDFHMIDSAFWGTGSDEVSGPSNSPSYQGVALGIRPMVGQAVHQLLPEWGAKVGAESPAQLQEVIWAEWKRGKEDGSWGELETLARS